MNKSKTKQYHVNKIDRVGMFDTEYKKFEGYG
jgi:hypothetical protein